MSAPRPRPARRALRLVVPRYGAEVVGGTEALARRLARSLAAAGWAIEVWTSCALDESTWSDVATPGTSIEDGVTIRRFSVPRPRRPRRFRLLTRAVFATPARLRPERLWVTQQGPTMPLLLRSLPLAAPLPTLFSPYLYHPTLRGLPIAPGPRLLMPAAHDEPPLRLACVARAVAACGAILYHSEEERALLVEAHPLAAVRPSEVGSVAIDPPTEAVSDRFRSRHGIGQRPYLLYGGRWGQHKGIDHLLEAAQLLTARDAGIDLVLSGEAGTRVSPRPGIHPVGWLDEQERWDALAGAMAVVVPSFRESLSLLALEAWTVKRPVLLNAASPVLAGQARRSGGAIAYRGASELAAAAERLHDDPAEAAALGTAGSVFASTEYSWAAVHSRLERLIDAAAEAPR